MKPARRDATNSEDHGPPNLNSDRLSPISDKLFSQVSKAKLIELRTVHLRTAIVRLMNQEAFQLEMRIMSNFILNYAR